jgi:hypothetical protein
VKSLTEGLALNRRHHDQESLLCRQRRGRYAAQQCLEGFRNARPAATDRRVQAAAARRRLGHRAVPAQRLGAHAVPDAAAARGRDAKFFVGRREYDPKQVGFVTTPDDDGDDDGFWLDTAFRATTTPATRSRRMRQLGQKHLRDPEGESIATASSDLSSPTNSASIIEYLKVHRDLPERPRTINRRSASAR